MAKAKGKAKSKPKRDGSTSAKKASSKSSKSRIEARLDEANLAFGTDTFELQNGDKYEGEFCAHRSGLVWREGHGVYTTADGQTYEGEWRNDRLLDDTPVHIVYPKGTQYHGHLDKDKYNGPGEYVINNSIRVQAQFENNFPKDEKLILNDANDIAWEGLSNFDEKQAIFTPENQFFTRIPADLGIFVSEKKGKRTPKNSFKAVEREEVIEDEAETKESLKDQVFRTSKKTINDFSLTDSVWCQRYTTFKTRKKEVYDALSKNKYNLDKLNSEDLRWYDGYTKYKVHKLIKMKNKSSKGVDSFVPDSKLTEFYSDTYQNKWPALKVFRPTWDIDPDARPPSTEPAAEEVEAEEKIIKSTDVESISSSKSSKKDLEVKDSKKSKKSKNKSSSNSSTPGKTKKKKKSGKL